MQTSSRGKTPGPVDASDVFVILIHLFPVLLIRSSHVVVVGTAWGGRRRPSSIASCLSNNLRIKKKPKIPKSHSNKAKINPLRKQWKRSEAMATALSWFACLLVASASRSQFANRPRASSHVRAELPRRGWSMPVVPKWSAFLQTAEESRKSEQYVLGKFKLKINWNSKRYRSSVSGTIHIQNVEVWISLCETNCHFVC